MLAFVFTDVEDSTVRWEREPEAMRGAMAAIVSLTDEVAEACSGERAVEQGAGDSSVLVFRSPSQAMAAAIALQQRMLATAWSTEGPVRVRAAVHAGEVHHSPDGTFAGPTMNRCGRLLGCAHGGQVVVSMSTIHLAGDVATGVEVVDLGTHHLRGIEQPMHIAQLRVDGMLDGFPPLRTVDAAATRIPRYRSAFVGQEVLLAELSTLVSANDIVTLVGTGGCGKTRLAAEVASRAVETFRGGAVWVDLAVLDDPALVADAAASALALRCGARPPLAAVLDHLRARQVLVVIDNCEHLIDAAADLAVAIRDGCPSVTVLVTSREPLNVSEEVVRRVPSLPVPEFDTLDGVEGSPAGALLLARVRQARADFVPTDADAPALAELCRRLDGIPLALELAAARMRVATPEAVVDGLTERFRLLTGGGRNAIARQRTLEASVGWSYQLLTDVEATVFRRLCVFASPFREDAALAVAGADHAEREVLEALTSLVDRSLLQDAGGGRVRMLETLRHFARERLIESGDATELRDRHLAWFVQTCAPLEPLLEGPELRATLVSIDGQVDDLRAAMRWALDESGRPDDALAIVSPSAWYWILRARVSEALTWVGEALRADTATPHGQLRGWWATMQLLAHHRAQHDRLEHAWHAASAIAAEIDEAPAQARIATWWGSHLVFNRPDQGIAVLEAARDACDAAGEPFWAAYAEGSLALGRVFQGRDDLADEHLRAMAARRKAHPSTRLHLDELTRQIVVDYAMGRYAAVRKAADLVRQGLDGLSEINMQGAALAVAGWVEVERGNAPRVIDEMETLLARYLSEREYQHVPAIQLALSRALLAQGRPDEAGATLRSTWNVPEVQAFVRARLWFRHDLALAELLAGDAETAGTAFEALLADATDVANPQEQARSHLWLGLLDRRRGEHHRSEGHLHAALELHQRHGFRQMAAGALEAIAGLELDHGRPAVATRLMGAAAGVRAEGDVTVRVGWQADYDADRGHARTTLGETDFAQEWQHGMMLGLTAAVELARRGRGERGRPSFGWDSLTSTEQRVAGLLVAGRTNPEIARELLMGRETVKTHVSAILRKLGLANRTQVASAITARSQAAME